MHTYYYIIPRFNEMVENAREFLSPWNEYFPQFIAESAAEFENYISDRTHNINWPLTFSVYNKDKKLLGTFSVKKKLQPIFCAIP
jgi:hypothetical protein